MSKNKRYQSGKPHIHHGNWRFLYYRKSPDGTRKRVPYVLGPVSSYPTKASVMGKYQDAVKEVNSVKEGATFTDLAERYKTEILSTMRADSQAAYLCSLAYLLPKWGDRLITDLELGEYELWINSLTRREPAYGESEKTGQTLSRATLQKIKAMTHILYRHAQLWGWYPHQHQNPMKVVRVTGGKRARIRSAVVSAEQYHGLLADPLLPDVCKVMVQVAMITGMGVSEILGLRWEDLDFRNGVIHVQRSVVSKHVYETKNEYREDDVPMCAELAEVLKEWRLKDQSYGGWIFGSPLTKFNDEGVREYRPYHAAALQHDHLKPAGKRVGITSLGWHGFRHTHSADLEKVGASDRVQQKSMRHGTSAQTKKYGKHSPVLFAKAREAQEKVVEMYRTAKGTQTGTHELQVVGK